MEVANLEPAVRLIVRYVALGLSDNDICVELPQFEAHQIAKVRTGATFKRALAEMQAEIDGQVIEAMAEDPVRAYLKGKGLAAAQTLTRLMDNVDEETPHSVQAKAADSVLSKAGYSSSQETVAVPVLMLSQDKLDAIQAARPDILKDVPDCVDGHSTGLDLAQ